ncbi:MAG: hypothetical protein ACYDD4_14485, partial [Acidimicrobiales bacterium]
MAPTPRDAGGSPPPSSSRPEAEADPESPQGEIPPRSARGGVVWMLAAFLGFVGGQVASAVLLPVVAALDGHEHDFTQLASRAVPPAWIVVTELVGIWIGFLGAVVWASHFSGTGSRSITRDMGLSFRAVDQPVGVGVGLGAQIQLIPLLYLP